MLHAVIAADDNSLNTVDAVILVATLAVIVLAAFVWLLSKLVPQAQQEKLKAWSDARGEQFDRWWYAPKKRSPSPRGKDGLPAGMSRPNGCAMLESRAVAYAVAYAGTPSRTQAEITAFDPLGAYVRIVVLRACPNVPQRRTNLSPDGRAGNCGLSVFPQCGAGPNT